MSSRADFPIDGEDPQHYALDSSLNYTWDTGTLSWVKSTGAGSGGGPATIADGADVVLGSLADAAIVTDAAGTLSGKLRGLVKWAFERMPAALGQGTMAQSLRVVLPSDQSAVSVAGTFFQATQPVSAAALPLPTGAATSALQTQPGVDIGDVTINNAAGASGVNVQDGGNSLTVDAASWPLPTGAATETTLGTRLAEATFTTRVNTQGQKAMAASTPVVLASDQSAVSVSGPLTDAQLRAVAVPVSGTVTASGPLTDAQLRAAAVPVSGTVTSNQGTAGSTDWRTDLRRGQTLAFAAIDVAGSGDNTIVAADATKKVKVLSYSLVADGAVNARWKSGAGTSLTGAMNLVANGGLADGGGSAPASSWLFETAVNQALVLNLSGAVGARGRLTYFLEA